MHDQTRRLLCQTAFMIVGVLPTMLVVIWIGVVHSSTYQSGRCAAWEKALSQYSGLIVSLEAVTCPSSSITMLHAMQIYDPETGRPIAKIRQIELNRDGAHWTVDASQPEIQGQQVRRLWEVLHDRILRQNVASSLRVSFAAGEITLHDSIQETAATLTDVTCEITRSPNGPRAVLEFRDVAMQMSEPARLEIARDQTRSPPTTSWKLDTRSTRLLCSVLADYAPAFQVLGDQATFQGTISASLTADGWEGDLHDAQFRDVDLNRLVTDRYPHKLSGIASIEIARAKIRQGRVIDAAGTLRADGGVVSVSLLDQAKQTLDLLQDPRLQFVQQSSVVYDHLAFEFRLSSNGLELVGKCGETKQEIVMADQHGALLSSNPNEIMPAVALIRALAPDSTTLVPATMETDQLIRVLPIPAISTPIRIGDRPGTIRTPVRLYE